MPLVAGFERAIDGTTKVYKGYGIAASGKLFLPRNNGGWYIGVFFDYGYLEYEYRVMDVYVDPWGSRQYNREGRWTHMNPLGFGSNVGYKYQMPSGLYFRTGAYLGVMLTGKMKTWYNATTLLYEEDSAIYPFANLDLSIGFRF